MEGEPSDDSCDAKDQQYLISEECGSDDYEEIAIKKRVMFFACFVSTSRIF